MTPLRVTPELEARQESLERTLDVSRDMQRSRRAREVRSKTISIRRMTKRELLLQRFLYPDADDVVAERPATRGECMGTDRPCPFVSCRHHLYLDVLEDSGNIKLNFPDLEPEQLGDSCSLDVADRGPSTLERTGELMNMTRERVRQIERESSVTFRRRIRLRVLAEDLR